MYPNLEAEIARKGFTNADLSQICGIAEKSFSNKRTGKTEFVLSEMKALKNKCFPNCSLEYLFEERVEVQEG